MLSPIWALTALRHGVEGAEQFLSVSCCPGAQMHSGLLHSKCNSELPQRFSRWQDVPSGHQKYQGAVDYLVQLAPLYRGQD